MADPAARREVEPAAVDVEVPGPGVEDFELVAEVGEQPPEAIERTEVEALLANGSG